MRRILSLTAIGLLLFANVTLHAAIVLVTGPTIGGADSSATTVASATFSISAGNFVVCGVSHIGSGTITGATDTVNTYSVVAETGGNGHKFNWVYKENASATTTQAVTATFSGAGETFRAIACHQFSGVATASAVVDSDIDTSESSGVYTTPTLTGLTGTAGATIVGQGECDDSNFTAGSGYTLAEFAGRNYFASQYQIGFTVDTTSDVGCTDPGYYAAIAFQAAATANSSRRLLMGVGN